MMTEPVYYTTMPSPVGTLTLAAREAGLVGVYFELRRHGPPTQEALAWRPDDGTAEPASRVLKTARHQLEAYFAGTWRAFDVPLQARGGGLYVGEGQAHGKTTGSESRAT